MPSAIGASAKEPIAADEQADSVQSLVAIGLVFHALV
jgi:hypothetical protein